jgi:hypothetical protein
MHTRRSGDILQSALPAEGRAPPIGAEQTLRSARSARRLLAGSHRLVGDALPVRVESGDRRAAGALDACGVEPAPLVPLHESVAPDRGAAALTRRVVEPHMPIGAAAQMLRRGRVGFRAVMASARVGRGRARWPSPRRAATPPRAVRSTSIVVSAPRRTSDQQALPASTLRAECCAVVSARWAVRQTARP